MPSPNAVAVLDQILAGIVQVESAHGYTERELAYRHRLTHAFTDAFPELTPEQLGQLILWITGIQRGLVTDDMPIIRAVNLTTLVGHDLIRDVGPEGECDDDGTDHRR